MKTAKPTKIDDYIAMFPEETQVILQQVRDTIKKAAPGSGEKISYGIPTITMNDTYLIYFAGFTKHISVYPAPRENQAFKKELSLYKGGKGTAQFPVDKPIPFKLITRMVKFRLKENAKKVKSKRGKAILKRKTDR